jgi:hypothetical protein
MEARDSQTHSVSLPGLRSHALSVSPREYSIAFMFPIKLQSREIYVYASFPARSAAVPFLHPCHCRLPLDG